MLEFNHTKTYKKKAHHDYSQGPDRFDIKQKGNLVRLDTNGDRHHRTAYLLFKDEQEAIAIANKFNDLGMSASSFDMHVQKYSFIPSLFDRSKIKKERLEACSKEELLEMIYKNGIQNPNDGCRTNFFDETLLKDIDITFDDNKYGHQNYGGCHTFFAFKHGCSLKERINEVLTENLPILLESLKNTKVKILYSINIEIVSFVGDINYHALNNITFTCMQEEKNLEWYQKQKPTLL